MSCWSGTEDAELRVTSVAQDIRRGIEDVPACFAEMLHGDNLGKMLVQVSEERVAAVMETVLP